MNKMHRHLEHYIALIVARPKWVVGLSFLVMLAVSAGAVKLPPPTSGFRSLVGDDNPDLVTLEAFEDRYSASNTALIAMAPSDGTVFTRQTLGAVEELSEAGWRLAHSSRVSSLTNYSHSEADGDALTVGPLVEDAASLSDTDLARVKNIALNEGELTGYLVSRDGRIAGVAIDFFLPEEADPVIAEINDQLEELLSDARVRHPGIGYYVTGNVVMRGALLDAPLKELVSLGPFLLLVMVAAMAILLRSFFAVLIIVGVVGFMGNSTVGFAGWIGMLITPVTAVVPLIVVILGIAHSIHIVTTFLDGVQSGLEKKEAVANSLRVNALPVFLTSLTTAVGFLSLNFSASPSFRALGNLAAFSTLCCFVYSMTALPAMLATAPTRARRQRLKAQNMFEHLGEFVVKRRRMLLLVTSLVAVGLGAGVSQIEFTDKWTRYFDESYEFRRDTDFIVENLTGLDSLEYSLDSGREGGISNPEYLHSIDEFAEWYRNQPEVSQVRSFSDVMKRLNRNLHGDDPSFDRLPEDPELAAQYLLLYEFSLPYGSDLNDRIDVSKSSTRLTVVLRETSSKQIRELVQRSQDWLYANQPGIATAATGVSTVFANIALINNESMIRGMAVAMGIISLLMIPIVRTLRLGIACLIPNILPLIASFGLWGYLIGNVGFGASAVAATTMGIIVDDTIHFMTKYRKARTDGSNAEDAVRYAFRNVGRAMITTTIVLASGFFVFTASGFEANWTVGLLVFFILILAVSTDLLMLPPLLMVIDRKSCGSHVEVLNKETGMPIAEPSDSSRGPSDR